MRGKLAGLVIGAGAVLVVALLYMLISPAALVAGLLILGALFGGMVIVDMSRPFRFGVFAGLGLAAPVVVLVAAVNGPWWVGVVAGVYTGLCLWWAWPAALVPVNVQKGQIWWAYVPFAGLVGGKVRPVVVVDGGENKRIRVLPVTSTKPPSYAAKFYQPFDGKWLGQPGRRSYARVSGGRTVLRSDMFVKKAGRVPESFFTNLV